MNDHVYKITEIVGSSPTSIEDAVRQAVRKASGSIREMKWFTVGEIRGHLQNGEVAHWQVEVKLGFRVED